LLSRAPRSTLCPYTTLFRSVEALSGVRERIRHRGGGRLGAGQRVEERVGVAGQGRFGVGQTGADLCDPTVYRREGARELVQLGLDRKSTRLNSSHVSISYAV